MKNIFLFFLLFYFANTLKAQDQTELTINPIWTNIENGLPKEISKTYRITKDSLIIYFPKDSYLSKLAVQLNFADSFYYELLNTLPEKWENIEYFGKNCGNCDTSYGAKVLLQRGNMKKEFWIRSIGAGYPENIRFFTDKLFALVKL